MKVSLITTVFNEEESIPEFLKSVFEQTKLPDEIIVVDGGSTDETVKKISEFNFSNIKNAPNIKLIFKKGNRSVGRNEAISKAENEIIAITDAGCILDANWLKNLIKPFTDKKADADAVAGYYKGVATNIFQKCLIPYVLVMEDKLAEGNEFLPATRSMAIKKSVWERIGRFDEKLSHNEDYAFAIELKKLKVKIVFQKDAFVNWMPVENFNQAYIMFFRFAFGDIESGIFRPKVSLIFARYILGLIVLLSSLYLKSVILIQLLLIAILFYLVWAVFKNYKYVKDYRAIIYLPLFQITSDIAVIKGSIAGAIKRII
jgi:glycosyltransferase involved in cell wall biosynthesis